MKLAFKKVSFVAILVLMNIPALKSADTGNADMKFVADLDTQYQKAVEQNDAETMDKILADDFVLVTGLGKIYTKADLLAEARTKRTIYEFQNDTRRTVRLWGKYGCSYCLVVSQRN
jgi:hypothetical protein